MDKTIVILVATHKLYEVPTSNLYLPIYIGKKDNQNVTFQRDDAGNNIADKNFSYCELTAVYWAWKNQDSDYYGLCHYRRRRLPGPMEFYHYYCIAFEAMFS